MQAKPGPDARRDANEAEERARIDRPADTELGGFSKLELDRMDNKSVMSAYQI